MTESRKNGTEKIMTHWGLISEKAVPFLFGL